MSKEYSKLKHWSDCRIVWSDLNPIPHEDAFSHIYVFQTAFKTFKTKVEIAHKIGIFYFCHNDFNPIQ